LNVGTVQVERIDGLYMNRTQKRGDTDVHVMVKQRPSTTLENWVGPSLIRWRMARGVVSSLFGECKHLFDTGFLHRLDKNTG
jgi:hypothetical protein